MGAMGRTIERAEVAADHVVVWLEHSDTPLSLSAKWIRDHSQDAASYDPVTKQRTIDTFEIAADLRPASVDISNGDLHVTWLEDEPNSFLTADLLISLTNPTSRNERLLWQTPNEIKLDQVPYRDVVEGGAGLQRWLDSIETYGFGMISGAPTEQHDAGTIANLIGYVRHTVFGGLWTLSSEVVAHADSAYGADTLEPHTDGCYSHDGPGMQFFLCSERTGEGGESVLVDGFAAAVALRDTDAEAFDILTKVSVPGHYIEEGVHLQASRPTIRLDANGNLLQVTFNNYDRSPFLLPEPQMSEWYRAYQAFHDLLVDESSWWKWRLEPGDALIFDNWRCLHGRMAYTGKRVFHGGYLNHEDLESRLRVGS